MTLARALFGRLPGGVAIVAIVSCAFFTAITGASGVTIVALGGLLYPFLRKDGFSDSFTTGLLTTGGSLGLLFAPSLPIIVYGLVAGIDIDTLFIAAAAPGLLLVLVLSGYSMIVRKKSAGECAPTERMPLWPALKGACFEAPIPFLVLGGIYSGAVTATEASPLTAAYCLLIEIAIYRDVKLRYVPQVMKKTAVLTGAILVIVGMAMGLKDYLVWAKVPDKILALMGELIESRITFLLVLNLFLLVVGCLLDIFSATLVVVPLIAPLAVQFGVDPVHLAVVFLTNLEIGYLTPPVGINLFLGSLRFRRPVLDIARMTLPFLLLLFFCLAIITYVPSLSTALVNLTRGAPKSETIDRTRPDGVREVYVQWTGRDGKPVKNGAYTEYYPSGHKRVEGHFRHDQPHGVFKTYLPGARPESEGEYRFGHKYGVWMTWHPSGGKKAEATYKNDRLHGMFKSWYERGTPNEVGEYAFEKRTGDWIYYYEDGKKQAEGAYRDDREHGPWRNWDEDGTELPVVQWRDGVEVK